MHGRPKLVFLECMRRDLRDDDSIESRYEAAATLHGWLRQLLDAADCDAVIRTTANSITDLFLLSGEDIRDAIETGFLEHALESVGLRPYFEHWAEDPRLREAWERALEWGKAHPTFLGINFRSYGESWKAKKSLRIRPHFKFSRSALLLLFHLRPSIFQRHGSIKHRLAGLRVRIDAEISQALELITAANGSLASEGSSFADVITLSEFGFRFAVKSWPSSTSLDFLW